MSSAQRFEGKSFDAALEKACSFYGRDKDDLEVSVIDSGSSGIFGLGGRDCVIEASPKLNKQEELESLIRSTVQDMVNFLVDSCEISVEMNGSRAVVGINTEDNHGLLIGREGQTISSLEYLVNRIVSKHWQEKVYVQLDTGGYKTQQEEQIKKTAQDLARKAKSSGKPMSTKPLSSYHRRLVHVALQEDEEVQTHSKGEGPKKRVSIKPKGASRNKTEERE